MRLRRTFLATLAGAAGASASVLPRQAPDFVFALPDGKQRKLSEWRGKVVAVSFISTT